MNEADHSVLETQTSDGVLWLTKQNPHDNFGMSLALLEAMGKALDAVQEDSTIRGVVIDAGGRGFHAGAVAATELQPRLEDLGRNDFKRLVDISMLHSWVKKLLSCRFPSLASSVAAHSAAAWNCYYAVILYTAWYQARFSFPEVTLGFVAAWGGTQISARLLPFRRAQEMLLLGEAINGQQAEEYGLVTRSFADTDALDTHITTVLARLRLCSPASMRWAKECLTAAWDGSLELGLEKELEAETEAMASGDFLKGLSALREGANFDYAAGKAVAKKSR